MREAKKYMKSLKRSELKENFIVYENEQGGFYSDNEYEIFTPFLLLKPVSEQVFFIECGEEVDYYIERKGGVHKVYFLNHRRDKVYLKPDFVTYEEADAYLDVVDKDCPAFVRQSWFCKDLSTDKEYRKEIVASANRWKYNYKYNFNMLNYEILEDDVVENEIDIEDV